MKTIAIIMLAMMFSINLAAQKTGNPPKTKEQKAAEREIKFQGMKHLLEDQYFVLEADFLGNGFERRPVVSTLNFITVDSTATVVQTGNNFGMGYNGVGGLTVEGRISKYTVNADKKRKSFTVTWNMSSTVGFYNVSMNVSASGRATATLTGNTSGRLVYDGWLIPGSESRTFTGGKI
jgi:hypothetical protein